MLVFARLLRYFMAVGRSGSIRRAADILNVSASSVDRQILQAEESLGMPLFERRPSGLYLTAAGEILMAAGSRWEKGLADVLTQIEDLRGLRRGHIDVAVIDALSYGYVPTIIEKIQGAYPGITISTKVPENLRVRDALTSGDADVGIFLEPQSHRNIVVKKHVEARLGFVVRPDHPLAAMTICRFSACEGQKMIVPIEPLALCESVRHLESVTQLNLKVAASSDNIHLIKSLVMSELGIGILTSIDVMTEVSDGRLVFVGIAEPSLRPMTLGLCTSSTRTLSSAAKLFLTAVEETFEEPFG